MIVFIVNPASDSREDAHRAVDEVFDQLNPGWPTSKQAMKELGLSNNDQLKQLWEQGRIERKESGKGFVYNPAHVNTLKGLFETGAEERPVTRKKQ